MKGFNRPNQLFFLCGLNSSDLPVGTLKKEYFTNHEQSETVALFLRA